MSIVTYRKVLLTDRNYPAHGYVVERYEPSGKINIRLYDEDYMYDDDYTNFILKMSTKEAEDLIVILQYVVHEAKQGL